MKHEDPLDRIFQERLADYAVDPPMHLWKGMMTAREHSRSSKVGLLWRTYALLLACLLLPAAGAFLYNYSLAPEHAASPALSSFLIPVETGSDVVSESMPVVPVEKELPGLSASAEAKDTKRSNAQGTYVVASTPAASRKNAPSLSEPLAAKSVSSGDLLPVGQIASSKAERPASLIVLPDISDEEAKELSGEEAGTPAGVAIADWEHLSRLPALWEQSAMPAFALADPEDCHSFSKKGWKVYGDLLLASEIPVRSLAPREPEYTDYAKARIHSEKQGFSFSMGARMTAVAGNGVALRAGMQYTQFNETFSYENENEQRINIVNIFDDDGNIISTDTVLETGTRIKVTYNKYHMVDIPVMAGYELNFPRLTLSVYGGTYINLLFRQKGDILGTDLKPVSISSSDADALDAFRANLGMSLAGSIGLNYRLTDKVQVILEPQFRYFLKPFSKDSYVLKQEYAVTTITTGLRFQLFGKKDAKK